MKKDWHDIILLYDKKVNERQKHCKRIFLSHKCYAYRSKCSYSMHGTCLHKTSRRDTMARGPRRDLLHRDLDETRDASVRDRETRPRRWGFCLRRDRDVSTSWDRLETKTSRSRPHPCLLRVAIRVAPPAMCVKPPVFKGSLLIKIRSVEWGICPMGMLYNLAAAFDALVNLQPILSLNKNGWLPWQQGSSGDKFTWHHYSPGPKIGGRCKQHAIILYGDRVIPLWSPQKP